MKRSLFYLILFPFLLVAACTKEEAADPNYPTTIERASSGEIDQLIARLSKTPLSDCTAVDSFGFCLVNPKLKDCGKFDTVYVYYTQKAIENLFYQSILEYRDLLNVSDTAGITVRSITDIKGVSYDEFYKTYPDSVPKDWVVTSNLQTLNGFEIPKTEIKMLISFDQVRSIGGKRYHELYVPATDIFSEESAKASLLDVELTDGNYTLTPTQNTYWYPSEKIVFPIVNANRIELRICWSLYPVNWQVVVDTQTGEVLSAVDVDEI
ncbi:MAG TPA: hypothetical protein PKH79_12180 [Prolixibacteraceae bacterium]|nr:hypothetical protein [Prolixibacteraceae bacterium]HPS14152.1 hypothetical protein [Prolixibacteraceae bacterium]